MQLLAFLQSVSNCSLILCFVYHDSVNSRAHWEELVRSVASSSDTSL